MPLLSKEPLQPFRLQAVGEPQVSAVGMQGQPEVQTGLPWVLNEPEHPVAVQEGGAEVQEGGVVVVEVVVADCGVVDEIADKEVDKVTVVGQVLLVVFEEMPPEDVSEYGPADELAEVPDDVKPTELLKLMLDPELST